MSVFDYKDPDNDIKFRVYTKGFPSVILNNEGEVDEKLIQDLFFPLDRFPNHYAAR